MILVVNGRQQLAIPLSMIHLCFGVGASRIEIAEVSSAVKAPIAALASELSDCGKRHRRMTGPGTQLHEKLEESHQHQLEGKIRAQLKGLDYE